MNEMVLKILYNCILVQLLIFLSSTNSEFASVVVTEENHNGRNIGSVFLGCFVSWEDTEELIRQGSVKILKTDDIATEFKSCNSWCQNQSPNDPVVLKRGDFCICTNWEKFFNSISEVTKVQLNLCDFPCYLGTTNEASSGQCGGNFFYSISCTNSSANSSVENQSDDTQSVCTLPDAITTNYHYVLQQSFIFEPSQVSHTCVDDSPFDITQGSHPMTYLPRNSPTSCLQYCMNTGKYVNISSLYVALSQQMSSMSRPYNCYCVDTSFAHTLLQRNVSNEYCQPHRKPLLACPNCNENLNHPTYTTLYTLTIINTTNSNLKIYENSEHLVSINTDNDLDNRDCSMCAECSYFHSYKEFQGSECLLYYDEEAEPLIHGFWTNCNTPNCTLTYRSSEHFLKAVTVNYYIKPNTVTPKHSTDSYIVVKFDNQGTELNCTSKQYNSISGWSRLYCTLPSTLTASEVTIEILSDFDGDKNLDFILVDNVTLVMQSHLNRTDFSTSLLQDIEPTPKIHDIDNLQPSYYKIYLDYACDLEDQDWSIPFGSCVYFPSYKEIDDSACSKLYERNPDPSTGGYWTNCDFHECLIGYTTNKHVVHSIIIYYYFKQSVESPTSLITLSFKHKHGSHWTSRTIPLQFGWSPFIYHFPMGPITNPEIKLNVSFGRGKQDYLDFIMIDKVILLVTENIPTTEYTTVTLLPTTSTLPENPSDEAILDTVDDIGMDWTVSTHCVYQTVYSEFTFCNPHIANYNEDSKGYWSDCYNPSCTLNYTASSGTQIPIGIQVKIYMKSKKLLSTPMLTVTYGIPPTTYTFNVEEGWSLTEVVPLRQVPLGSVISLNQISNEGFIMVDKIIIKLKTRDVTTTGAPLPITCKDSEKCNATDHRGIFWSTCPGQTQSKYCPNESTGKSFWTCLTTGKFESSGPSYSQCSSDWISELERKVDAVDTVPAPYASTYLQEVIYRTRKELDFQNGGSFYYGHEMKEILAVEYKILMKLSHSTNLQLTDNLTSSTFTVIRNLLINISPWLDLNEREKVDAGTSLVQFIENSSFELISRAIEYGVNGKYSKNFNKYDEFQATAVSTEKNRLPIYFPVQYSHDDSYIELPSNWYEYFPSDQDKVNFVGSQLLPKYANKIFLDNFTSMYYAIEEKNSKIINGKLMSFTFEGTTARDLTNDMIKFEGRGIRIRFKHDVKAWGNEIKSVRRKLHVESGERAQTVLNSAGACVFWNTSNLNWSTFGCHLVERDSIYTICECNHLSSFALLMDVHNYVGKDRGLELLTWILCPISIICLIICIGIYSMSTVTAIRSPRSTVTIHLCVCLLLGNTLLLFFVDKDYLHLSQGFCTTFGIMTHYAFLAAFFWMGFEGYVLYKVVVVVFDDGQDRLVMQYVIAYGGPAVIVLCTGLTAVGLQDDAYDSDMFCWLNGNYIWGFMAPVALILLGNFAMLVVSVRKAVGMTNNSKAVGRSSVERLKKKPFYTWVRGSAGLTVLLGLTWGFGFFMLIDSSTFSNIAAYCFTVLNASQGIFLFIFHIVMNEKIRVALQRRLPNWVPQFFSQSQKTSSTFRSNPK